MLIHTWYLIKLLFANKNKKKFYFFLYRTLGFFPSKTYYFELAFIHKSSSIISDGLNINNERLEFLGDSILDAVIAEFLFDKFQNENEGFLTKLKSKIVNRENLNAIAIEIGIDKFIISQTNNTHYIKYINGNALEALIGAIFLDKGYNRTKKFIINRIIKKYIDIDNLILTDFDYKSSLIEWCQKNKHEIIFESYEDILSSEIIPNFISTIIINNKPICSGKGKSKKEAEQNASKEALIIIKNQ